MSGQDRGYGATLPARLPSLHGRQHAISPPLNNPLESDVRIQEMLYGAKKVMRVVIIGAGVSGISFCKFAEEQLENIEIVCYEKNDDIGGTWLENRYPGVACDIPSVVYQFPWRMAPWSKYYSHGPEIWKYLKMVAKETGFEEKYVKLHHSVESQSWQDENSCWTITVRDTKTGSCFDDRADVIINASGLLNKWKWPDIAGLHTFQGQLLHSANWNQDVDLSGKRVGLIGIGSSGIQILPNIYKQVSKVYTWVRSHTWITAGFAPRFAGEEGANFEYSEEQHKMFEKFDEYKAYCKMVESELNQRFSFIMNGSESQRLAREFSINEMKRKLQRRPELAEKIIPQDFFVGCRRPTPGNGYLEALTGEKTIVFTEEPKAITEKGFLDSDGQEHEIEVLICATGFDTTFQPRSPLIVNGADMGNAWQDRPHVPSYLSLGYAGVPNYFVVGGAYAPAAHGSFFPLIQGYVDYILQVIEKMQIERIKSLRPKARVTEHFLKHADSFLKRTAWTGPCSSWFKGGDPDATPAIYPGSRLHFLRLIERPRYEDYEIDYDDVDDVFSFMGNGFHMCERDGSDITWYLGQPQNQVDQDAVLSVMDGSKGTKLQIS